jgi:hypothetical protein
MSYIQTAIRKIKNLFKNEWNETHVRLWEPYRELNNEGFSQFQIELQKLVETVLRANAIEFLVESTDEPHLNDDTITVKLITLSLTNYFDSVIWIYHDMAEYDLIKQHHIFEEWGYLSPKDLYQRFIENIIKILNIGKT